MEIKPYGSKHPGVIKALKDAGILRMLPKQVARDDLEYDEGIDIIYEFKGLTPKKFEQASDIILLTAVTEAKRYKEYKYSFSKLDVVLSRTEKGKLKAGPTRQYIAAKNTDPDVMVYGEAELGYKLPAGQSKPFLVDRIKEILDIPNSPSPGAYITKQNPYRVTRLTICIRKGLRRI